MKFNMPGEQQISENCRTYKHYLFYSTLHTEVTEMALDPCSVKGGKSLHKSFK